VMLAQPLDAAISAAKQHHAELKLPVPKVVYLSPQGKTLTHRHASGSNDSTTDALLTMCALGKQIDSIRAL